ncbi:MAG: phosphatase PAP2 family protein [Deltaproteobacteria bacterium]|nr:phosphatase PAP2 family protein [Deltaproteobacteria bacterium]
MFRVAFTLALLVVSVFILGPRATYAQTITSSTSSTTSRPSSEPSPLPLPRLAWSEDWRRVGPMGYGAAAGLLLAAGATTLLAPHPPGGWKGSTPIDDWLFDRVRFDSRQTQDDVSAISDVFANLLMLFPMIDVGVSAGLLGDDSDLLLQLWSIDLEAAALAGSLLVLSKRLVSRVRPGIPVCEGTLDDYRCRSDASRRSFASGHATAAFTGAALTCLHHSMVPLYGGHADAWICGGMMGLALTTSLLRVASDQHYATDILGGAAIGLLSGFLVPYLLHFAPPEPSALLPSGHLQVLLGGGLWTAGDAGVVVGAGELGLELGYSISDYDLALAVDGRLLRRDDQHEMQAVLPRLIFGRGPLRLGLAADFRRQSVGDDRFDTFSAGPWVSVGADGLVASLGWMPAFDGRPETGLARLEFLPWPWLLVRAEAAASHVEIGGARTVGTFLLGAGGRMGF